MVGITVLVAVATLVPLPSAVDLRDWAQSVGPWFPLAFLLAHTVVTIFPVPRTAFTLAAGLLFGPAVGVLIAVAASTASAVLALLLVRAAGWRLNRLVRHQSIHTVDERLRERGWPTIVSLRLIPAVPFSVINYAAGASAVRLMPYTMVNAGRCAARHRGGGDPGRRARRSHQPVADRGVSVHRGPGPGGAGAGSPQLPGESPVARAVGFAETALRSSSWPKTRSVFSFGAPHADSMTAVLNGDLLGIVAKQNEALFRAHLALNGAH